MNARGFTQLPIKANSAGCCWYHVPESRSVAPGFGMWRSPMEDVGLHLRIRVQGARWAYQAVSMSWTLTNLMHRLGSVGIEISLAVTGVQ